MGLQHLENLVTEVVQSNVILLFTLCLLLNTGFYRPKSRIWLCSACQAHFLVAPLHSGCTANSNVWQSCTYKRMTFCVTHLKFCDKIGMHAKMCDKIVMHVQRCMTKMSHVFSPIRITLSSEHACMIFLSHISACITFLSCIYTCMTKCHAFTVFHNLLKFTTFRMLTAMQEYGSSKLVYPRIHFFFNVSQKC